ncbi:hypothetical protein F5X98DRAFT_104645 [Xylaria grammica]|nr:hypothetical protein F5X98DRAFT_104645 [Xylaria grammica]
MHIYRFVISCQLLVPPTLRTHPTRSNNTTRAVSSNRPLPNLLRVFFFEGLYASARIVLGPREGLVTSRQQIVFVPSVDGMLQDELQRTIIVHAHLMLFCVFFLLPRERGSKSSYIPSLLRSFVHFLYLSGCRLTPTVSVPVAVTVHFQLWTLHMSPDNRAYHLPCAPVPLGVV